MVTVYSKNNCMQCKMTKQFLDRESIPYQEINIDIDPSYIDHLKELGFSSLPVVETESSAFSGFRPDQLKALK